MGPRSLRIHGAAKIGFLCLAILGLSLHPASADASPAPSTLRTANSYDASERQNSWNLRNISADERTLAKGKVSLDTRFDLGATAEQREGQWYTVRFRVRILVVRNGPGRKPATLTATVNGRSGAMISLTPTKDRVKVFYTGALGGATTRYESGEHFTVDYENYTQDHAIKSGNNQFSVELEQKGGLVQKVNVEPVTGITRTNKAPQQLYVHATSPLRTQEEKVISLRYTVTRRGQRPDRPVTVRAQLIWGKGAQLVKDEHRYPSIGTGRHGQFEMATTKPGRYVVQVALQGGYNKAAQLIIVDVRPKGPSAAGQTVPLVASGVLVLLGVGTLIRPTTRIRRWLAARRSI